MERQLLLSVAMTLAFVAELPAQAPRIAAPAGGNIVQGIPPLPVFMNLNATSDDYQVGPGDLLEIHVVGLGDLNQVLRVSNSGEISFPMIGRIQVDNLTAFEIEDAIAGRLREKGYVERPEVLVFIQEYQAKPIYVSGAVVNPGEFVMSQQLTVTDAIILAGGLQFNAADEALLQRHTSREAGKAPVAEPAGETAPEDARADPGVTTIKVDLRPLKQGRFLDTSVTMKRGDVLVVPDIRMNPFYVVGEVNDPRNFFYPPGTTMTVSRAISWAAGPLPTAKMSKGMLVHYDDQGRRQELKVDYAAILRGDQKDFAIQPHDIIFIPGSKMKTIAHGLLGLTDTMVMQQAFIVGRRIQAPDPPPRREQ